MPKVNPCAMHSGALLERYQKSGYYTDCYSTDIPFGVTFEQFVIAFYSTRLFRLEGFILKWAVARPSTDLELAWLASGVLSDFAAWSVEDKADNQLLLSDVQGRTRSWLMIVPIETDSGTRTRLYFGSAIVPVLDKTTGERRLGFVYKALLGFHKLYSMALLSSAAASLVKKADEFSAVQ